MTAATAPSPSPTPTPSSSIPALGSGNNANSAEASATSHNPSTPSQQAAAPPAQLLPDTPQQKASTTSVTEGAASQPSSMTASTAPASSVGASTSSVSSAAQASTSQATLPSAPLISSSATPNRNSPSTPSATRATASTQLPAPYRTPKYAQTGASESFATAYPTREARQTYPSPSKPLLQAAGTPVKRSWRSTSSIGSPGAESDDRADAARKRLKSSASIPFGLNGLSPSATRNLATGSPASASSVTVTGIPKPGSALSNQVRAETINLISPNLQPSVSGSSQSAQLKDEYLSLLLKSELIDLVKQLEKQLLDSIAAQPASAATPKQARIYPSDLPEQVARLKARQRATGATANAPSAIASGNRTAIVPGSATSGAAATPSLSLNEVYSLLSGKPPANNSDVPSLSTNALSSPASARLLPSSSARPVPTASAGAKDDNSLAGLISSINALVKPQARTGQLPTAPSQSSSSATKPGLSASTTSTQSSAPVSSATIQSILGGAPMPSNASLAAAIAAHFGGNLPGTGSSAPKTSAPPRPFVSKPTTASQTGPPVTRASAPSKPAAPAGNEISSKIAAILGSSASAQTPMLGPQGIPLAPAPGAPKPQSGSVPIGNIAAMLSSLPSNSPGSSKTPSTPGKPQPESQTAALAKLLKQLEEAKAAAASQASSTAASAPSTAPVSTAAIPPRTTNGPVPSVSASSSIAPAPVSTTATAASAVHDPIAILTGASANPLFGTGTGLSSVSSFFSSEQTSPPLYSDMSSSPEAGPVMVQGPSGSSALPSYEEMIIEGLNTIGDENGTPPRKLFQWMVDTYPLMKNFRPSASQALQKAFKRGRLLKTGSLYRINPAWGGQQPGRKPTRRPKVGRDHPMVTNGPNGEMLALGPLKDSSTYRNSLDLRNRVAGKAVKSGPKPYGQPGADPLPNPASSIFQTGTVAALILSHQRRTGKTLDADSIKQLLQQIRSSPGGLSTSQALSTLLNRSKLSAIQPTSGTGDSDSTTTAPPVDAPKTATVSKPAAVPAPAAARTRPSLPIPSLPSTTPVSIAPKPAPVLPAPVPTAPVVAPKPAAVTPAAPVEPKTPAKKAAAPKPKQTPAKAKATANAAAAAAAVPAPAPASEPNVMQQLARMLNEMNVPLNPALASSLVGQLGQLGRGGAVPTPEALAPLVTAAAASASHANSRSATPRAGTPTRTVAPTDKGRPVAVDQLSTGVSAAQLAASLSAETSQQDLDSAVSATLAAALKQIDPVGADAGTAAASTVTAPASTAPTADSAPVEAATAQDKGKAVEVASRDKVSANKEGDKAPVEEDGEGIDLADYEDAIRTLTAALNGYGDDDDEESDEEADERAIAAAEADPVEGDDDNADDDDDDDDDRPAPMSSRVTAASASLESLLKSFGVQVEDQAGAESQAESASAAEQAPSKAGEANEAANEEDDGDDDEEDEDEDDADTAGMDLSAIISQLSASLQGSLGGGETAQQGEGASSEPSGSGESLAQKDAMQSQQQERQQQEASQSSSPNQDNTSAASAAMDTASDPWNAASATAQSSEGSQRDGENSSSKAPDAPSEPPQPPGDATHGAESNSNAQATEDEPRAEAEADTGDDGNDLQAQLEALVASLAANADADSDEDDDDDQDAADE